METGKLHEAVYGPWIMRVGIEKSRNLMTVRLAMTSGWTVYRTTLNDLV